MSGADRSIRRFSQSRQVLCHAVKKLEAMETSAFDAGALYLLTAMQGCLRRGYAYGDTYADDVLA